MSSDVLYQVLKGLLNVSIWGGELVGEENLRRDEPAVFIGNHALALGPIAVCSSLPVRLYPWVAGDMLDFSRAAAYLNRDFVEPQLHIPPPLSMSFSRFLSKLSVRLLSSVECIPVWQNEEVLETYRISVDYLQKGRHLLIFPEDPTRPPDEQCRMSPFKKGFARLGEMYYERTQNILHFYPMAVHPGWRVVKIGKPISFNPKNNPANERIRIKSVLESMIRTMYLEMTLKSYAGIPLPH